MGRIFVAAALFVCLVRTTWGHETRPAFLEVDEYADGRYDVSWKQPTLGEIAVHLVPHLSNRWLDVAPDRVENGAGYREERWRGRHPSGAGLGNVTVTVEGLDETITDVLVLVRQGDGKSTSEVLRAGHASFTIQAAAQRHRSIPAYLRLGVEHILTGVDHLSFVLGLVLLVRARWMLFKTITAFTLAHSITLAAATLGWIQVSPPVVESLVALSILFLAVELVKMDRGPPMAGPPAAGGARITYDTLAIRRPWLIAFVFGLLHGLAFAGSLSEVGVPGSEIPLALVLFNVGVEAGQLCFVGLVLAVMSLIRPLRAGLPHWTRTIVPYAIGAMASFWFLQRLTAVMFATP